MTDNNGDVLELKNNHKALDLRKAEARELWTQGAADVILASGGAADGVFIDGLHKIHLANCHYNTCGADHDQCCDMSQQDEDDFNHVSQQIFNNLFMYFTRPWDKQCQS